MEEAVFGQLPDGTPIHRYTLSNGKGLLIRVLNLGGLIQEWHTLGSDGQTTDIALGLPTLEDYLAGHPFFGVITGRVAGRISGGQISLDGKNFQLEVNQPPNHLHGGSQALDKRIWEGSPFRDDQGQEWLQLTYLSPDGEEGYPGNLKLTVRYAVTSDNEVILDYHAQSDVPTPVSLTNHTYFNLSGEGSGSIEDHILEIPASRYVPADADMTLCGQTAPVEEGGNDFRKPRCIGDALPHLHCHHGDNYVFDGGKQKEPRLVARVIDPRSGRIMEALSTEACLQFYTGVNLDGSTTGKNGQSHLPHHGFCLECQGYPDGVSHPEIDDIVIRPDQPYRQRTIYRFPDPR